ncbi:MAG: hypothetical protein AB1403_14505 [Candidatus Riflebacteria bacterium]
MKACKNFSFIALLLVLVLQFSSLWAASSIIPADNKPIKDLTKAYEAWKNQGIKFVVRDSQGKFLTWNIGKLESWDGKSKWVVRDPKGHFLTHAIGNVEKWKNGQTRLVLRDKKGRMLTHVSLQITDKSSFAANVVGLRHLKNPKYLAFVQDTLADLLIQDIEADDFVRVRVLVTYLNKYKNDKGVENFKPVLRKILPKLNFIVNHNPGNNKVADLTEAIKKTLVEL